MTAAENVISLAQTIAALRGGLKIEGRHVGGEVYALHAALRAKGWLHGWSMARQAKPVGWLLEVARDAHEALTGNRANVVDTNRV